LRIAGVGLTLMSATAFYLNGIIWAVTCVAITGMATPVRERRRRTDGSRSACFCRWRRRSGSMRLHIAFQHGGAKVTLSAILSLVAG